MRVRLLAFFLLLCVSGCAVNRADVAVVNSALKLSPKDTDHPVILTMMDLKDPYEEIGYIHVTGATREGYAKINEKMKMHARLIGADAVIMMTYGTENAFSIVPFFIAIPYDVNYAEGVAVRKKR